MMTSADAAALIKAQARALGFEACGIAEAAPVEAYAVTEMQRWLDAGYAADMAYMYAHGDLRSDPRLLQPGARSLIVVALNYFPARHQAGNVDFAYYAYGADYHYVVKQYLNRLYDYIASEIAPILMPDTSFEGRPFTDSAPLMERYWAWRAGVGFVGRNRLLILPHHGSYYFIGVLAVNLPLPSDAPLHISCGRCRRCLEACPTRALHETTADGATQVDARLCISYQTIENRTDEIPAEVAASMGHRVYGCDACQQACPWNRFATPTRVPEFRPSADFLALDADALSALGSSGFKRMFRFSAVQRAGYKGLLRNLRYVKPQ